VRDLEYLRSKVLRLKKLFFLCQSYGGFILFTYLSLFPESVKGAIISGGVPPITKSPVKIYEGLVQGIYKKNEKFYKAYPKDRDRVKRIVDVLKRKPVDLGGLGVMTADRFLDAGMVFARSDGIQVMHHFLDDPFLDSSGSRVSFDFALRAAMIPLYEINPIYTVLHESIYCDKMTSNWAAENAIRSHPGFSPDHKFISFYGETMRRKIFDDYGKLRCFKKAAGILAKKKDWDSLYDMNILSKCRTPVECMVYKNDYCVKYEFSREIVRAIPGVKAWYHQKWEHDGLRLHGKKIITKLLGRLEKRVKDFEKR